MNFIGFCVAGGLIAIGNALKSGEGIKLKAGGKGGKLKRPPEGKPYNAELAKKQSTQGFFALVLTVAIIGGVSFLVLSPGGTRAPEPAVEAAPAPATTSTNVMAGTEAAQQEAIRRYPSLAVKGSPLQVKFAERVKQYQASQPAYFQDKTWPLKMANELAGQK